MPLPPDRHDAFSRTELALLATLLLGFVPLVLTALHGSAELLDLLRSEDGPLERFAAFAWAAVAVAVLTFGGRGRHAVALALIALVFCLRELDLHKIVAGESFLKNAFYRDASIAPADRLLGGLLAATTLGLLLWGLTINGRAFRRGRLHRRAWGRIVVAGVVLLLLSKLFDRLPAVLAVDHGIVLGETVNRLVTLQEEWLECFVPVSLGVAAWLRARA